MDGIQQEAAFFKALANPKRLEMVALLQGKDLCVGETTRKIRLPQANVSQHLMVLRKAKIVNTKKIGQKMYYHIVCPRLIQITATMVQHIIDR
ncbi:MAG: metalloregulator ArsR/SmtB family transcription factor [Candidatus Woesebacteria bacterium]